MLHCVVLCCSVGSCAVLCCAVTCCAVLRLICTKVSPVEVAQNAVEDARSACMRTYGSAPEVEIYGDPSFTFAYVEATFVAWPCCECLGVALLGLVGCVLAGSISVWRCAQGEVVGLAATQLRACGASLQLPGREVIEAGWSSSLAVACGLPGTCPRTCTRCSSSSSRTPFERFRRGLRTATRSLHLSGSWWPTVWKM